ncbi:MAG: FAD-dependent oxidoreductase, partial [Mycetocola sp.]
KTRWDDAQDLIIVGGGFIGLEVAAAAARAGKHVTVVEVADRLIGRALSGLTGQFLLDAHRRRGVDIRLNEAVTHIHGHDGQVTGVTLSTGESLPSQIVMVGIGALPRLHIAEQLGLATALGAIVVDEFAETSQPGIVAAGDAVLLPHPLGHEGLVRLESVQNAVDQAKVAAKTLVGRPEPSLAVAWFWSDQADLKLQIAGLSAPTDELVLRGDPAAERYSALFYRNGILVAVEAVNSPADYMAVRRALAHGATISAHAAPDTTVPLKTLVVEAQGADR